MFYIQTAAGTFIWAKIRIHNQVYCHITYWKPIPDPFRGGTIGDPELKEDKTIYPVELTTPIQRQ